MPLTVTPNRRHRGLRVPSSSPSVDPTTSTEKEITSGRGAFSPRMPILTGTPTRMSKEVPIAPKTTTPMSLHSSTPSWEDYDEGVFGAVSKARRSRESGASTPQDASFSTHPTIDSSYEDEEMPMDELMGSSIKSTTPVPRAVGPSPASMMPNGARSTSVSKMTAALQSSSSVERPDGLSLEERMLWDSIQSILINSSKRANKSTFELERRLRESEARVEKLSQKVLLATKESTTASPQVTVTRINQLEEQLREAQTMLKKRDSEHDAEVRAIQRVLAEMTNEREEETQVLNDTVATLSEKVETLEKEKQSWHESNPPPPPPSPPQNSSGASAVVDASKDDHEEEIQQLKTIIKGLESEKIATQKDLDRKARHAMVLERDYKVLKVQLKKVEEERKQTESSQPSPQVEALKAELEKVKERNQKLTLELDAANKERKTKKKTLGAMMTPPRPDTTSHTDVDSVASSMSAEDVDSLQKNLCETTSSLENAKKIIASLENANGSMAIDLRAKLKAKEEELAAVQKEAAERKRRLDSLATELRDLQKKQDDVDRIEAQSKTQVVRHKALMGLLEKSVSGLQAASAVHEVTTASGQPDLTNVEQISDILNDAMVGIRTSLELSEQYIDEFDDDATAFTDVDVASEVGRQIDAIIKNDREALAKNLQNELEQKKIAVRRLEEALKKQNEEIRRLRVEQRSTGDNQGLLAEIKTLRDQCSTNKELLAKKERELSVLRSSLKVDDNDAGYISDDASEGEDENDTTVSSSSRMNGYGAEKTEALATLLAAGGVMPDQPELKKELLKAIEEKERAAKELQDERESLANAKLIISSLEKANKSMMEDLRSRLQDSNTAISSLLDKSQEHEKNSDTLRKEVEKLKKEKETLESKLQEHDPEAEKSGDEIATALSEEKKDFL